MKKKIFFTLLAFLLLFLLALTACGKPGQVLVPTATNWVPTFGQAQNSDDIIITSGVPAYAGNTSSANTTGTLNPVSIIQTTLSQNEIFAHITYRVAIESQKPAVRNDIINVFLTGKNINFSQPGNTIQSLGFYTLDLPRGVTITEGMQLPGDLSTSSVLVLNITEDAKTGKHEFEIGLIINGVDFGTLPCTLTLID
jgi:predicted small lipoprotein YifL